MTLSELRAIVQHCREHAIKTAVVETQEEADIMTAEDPLGRTWSVGDEYYTLRPGSGSLEGK